MRIILKQQLYLILINSLHSMILLLEAVQFLLKLKDLEWIATLQI